MIFLVAYIALVATVASLTRLVTTDEITAPFRVRLRKWSGQYGFWTRATDCDRCTSVWIAPIPTLAFVLAVAHSSPSWGVVDALGAWIPVSFGVAYLSFILIHRGEQ
jgi:hypothetical protein